ncbi:MAG: hypothetical protein U5P10_09705 [Spirochaetia bacterium]|nr:hypothetical protein [Spirochaetia bacterium]
MNTKNISLSIITFLLVFSCASPGRSAAENVVQQFVDGLYAGDAESIRRAAPFFDELPQQQREQLYDHIGQFSTYDIKTVQINGRSATVLVEFSNKETSLQMQFPLKAQDDSWRVQETISYSATIDFIPAEP